MAHARDKTVRWEREGNLCCFVLSKDHLKINILSHMTSDRSVKTVHEKCKIVCAMKMKQYTRWDGILADRDSL